MKKEKTQNPQVEEWNLSQGMGILPEDIPFTQNIGCVGGGAKNPRMKNPKAKNKS